MKFCAIHHMPNHHDL